jgi:capsular polysaccharide export protein
LSSLIPSDATNDASRRFLFLQGPHGPFFYLLARALRRAGAQVWRVGFNAGDRAFWFGSTGYIPFRGTAEDWPDTFAQTLDAHAITDIVLYGDTRPIHATAKAEARRRGLRIHVFEEGYMRPYWVTYERDASNGNSALLSIPLDAMRAALGPEDAPEATAPTGWGDLRQHVFYGALYHWFVMFRNGDYPAFRSHRARSVPAEAWLYTRRLLLMPAQMLHRLWATTRITLGGWPYHIVLLQLDHDASFLDHSPFEDIESFLEAVVDGFARGAPRHHHLVFKAHPLDHGGTQHRAILKRLARQHDIADRLHFVRGGKLARLLDNARSAVTVNSTAGQQVLWRGLPLKALGQAVYSRPDFVDDRPLAEFFANPARPDAAAYRTFRRFLLATSQVPGGFYSFGGRRRLLRALVDRMLSDQGPYEAILAPAKAEAQTLRLVR